VAAQLRGWHPDPFGLHELRYFSLDGEPTRLVSDAGRTSHDPPRPAPPAPSLRPAVQVTAATRPALPSTSLPTVQYRSGISDADYAVLPIRGAPITLVNSSPNSVEGSREITAAATFSRTCEGASAPVDLKFLDTLFPNLTPARRAALRRFVRYGSVSAISTVTALAILGTLVGAFGYPAAWSNVVATGIATIPSFELNRRWVWANNRRSISRQAVPYFILSFAGLIVSTYAVHLASGATIHASRLAHTSAAELANVAAYGSLWLVQFFLCDRVLFRPPKAETTTSRQDRGAERPVSANAPASPAEAIPV
jgi:putative flippase GtrA